MMQRLAPKLLSWASVLEDDALAQAERTSRLPFVHPHMALMPDAHLGKGATVGSVIPTLGAVIPAAVGVDIGCGMMAMRSTVTVDRLPADLRGFRQAVEAAVPCSAGTYNQTLTPSAQERVEHLTDMSADKDWDPAAFAPNWAYQLGTLGGGNHFIEVSADEEGRVWLFLHSGSRGVGNRIASRHIKVAKELMQRWWISLEDPDLAYLVQGTPEFTRYMTELSWAQAFAAANRAEMMDRVRACFTEWAGAESSVWVETIQCHHNYTVWERHGGKNVIVSRKGAIDAHVGVPGLIPGSMGTASYVVTGLGKEAALCSAPHGAGRAMSRAAARAHFTQDDLRQAMRGIEFRDDAVLVDEIPGAYKDIAQVIADSADLVDVVHTLHQIVNVKGD